MNIIFYERKDNIVRWLKAKGYSGTYYDMLMKYFQSKATNKNGTLLDMVKEALFTAGF